MALTKPVKVLGLTKTQPKKADRKITRKNTLLVLSWVFEYLIHAMFCDTSWDWVLLMDLDDYLCWIFWIFPSICCANSMWRNFSFDYFDPQQDPHQDFLCQNRHLFSDGSNLSKFSWQLRVGQKDRYLFMKRRIKFMKKQHKFYKGLTCLQKDRT